jgi:hypothetical protein
MTAQDNDFNINPTKALGGHGDRDAGINPHKHNDYARGNPTGDVDPNQGPTPEPAPEPAPEPTPTPLNPFDLDGDGCVSAQGDYPIFHAAFGTKAGDPHYKAACDFNGDGYVNADDFVEFARHMGEGCG